MREEIVEALMKDAADREERRKAREARKAALANDFLGPLAGSY